MSKIQKRNIFYDLLRAYAKRSFLNTYSKVEVYGLENIPENASVIYAPNHTSGLIDPLSILFMDRKYKVFVARADIFRKPAVARILYFFKLMPINRMRDGMSNMTKNDRTFDIAVDILKDKVPFVIFSEGTHRYMHSLMTPLQKGIFRIALRAAENPEIGRPVCIVPVGVEYSSYFRFTRSQIIRIGKPLEVNGFIEEHKEMEHPEMMNIMRVRLAEEMKKLILYVPDDENYGEVFDICRIWAGVLTAEQVRSYIAKEDFNDTPELESMAEGSLLYREIADKAAVRLFEESPEDFRNEVLTYGREFTRLRKERQVRINAILHPASAMSIAGRSLLLILLLPYLTAAAILNLPTLISGALGRAYLEDKAFINTYRFVSKAVIWPVTLITMTLILAINVSFTCALCTLVLFWFSPGILYRCGKIFNDTLSDIRYRKTPSLKDLHDNIRNMLGRKMNGLS